MSKVETRTVIEGYSFGVFVDNVKVGGGHTGQWWSRHDGAKAHRVDSLEESKRCAVSFAKGYAA